MTTSTSRTQAIPSAAEPDPITPDNDARSASPLITTRAATQRREPITSKDKNQSQDQNDKDKNQSKCTSNPNDQAHQCIARSDGVVRALRARTGDQHQQSFKIV